MCTVTYIPLKDKVFITTNRDENILRTVARPPECYTQNNHEMIYPKDGSAGGTWVTVCENGNTGVLINGAFEKHQQKQKYKRSRGLVLLDLMKSDIPLEAFKKYDFYKIEPFTVIIRQIGHLYECRWDGQKKYILSLDHHLPYIWSSCTLYDAATQVVRNKNFHQWFNHNNGLTSEDVIHFHKALCCQKQIFPVKDEPLQIKTVSITMLQLQRLNASMIYYDWLQDKIHAVSMRLREAAVVQ